MELPKNIDILCCQSCRYGNFCPFGDNDNEIYCLKGFTFKDKSDVCTWFSKSFSDWEALAKHKRPLLHYCKSYKPIREKEFYTYNDWEYYMKKRRENDA